MNYQTQMKVKRWLRKPLVMYAFLGIQTIVFILMTVSETFGSGLLSNQIVGWGAMFKPYVVMDHEYWRFITPIFIHFGIAHFALNSITLYYLGSQIETVFGHWRFFLIYLGGGILGNAVSFAFGQANAISAGASTSLFGLFGAFVVIGYHFRHNPAIAQMARQYFMLILLNLGFNLFMPSIDILGHIGGVFGGALVANVLGVQSGQGDFTIHDKIIGTVLFIFILVICLILGFKKYGFPV
ncbi:peptidase S54 [Enterococcus canis]|uniref:Peptidase S54 n=1 Tax=Enterococcus canis TaxID=214095 RepID=A0A1L8RIV9_9ENTE|nr:rhomboid family intramembrane serine protease [Enterococcus canis]OJG19699.1 peptidase S54 [Enterococcus canis]